MDSLIKQIRARFSSTGQVNTEESYSSKERRIPPQRTPSFKTEKKRAQNWFRRQFSRNMSQDYDSENQMEHVTAVAAAAYAINSLEDSVKPDQKKTSAAPESFSSRVKSKKEDTPIQVPEPGRVSKRFSGENATTSSLGADSKVPVTAATDEKKTEKANGSPAIKKNLTFADEHLESPDTTKSKRTPDRAPSIKKTPTFSDERLNIHDTTKPNRAPERVTDPAPSMKKTSTSSNEPLSSTNGRKPAEAVPKTDMPPRKPRSAASKPETRSQSSRRPGTGETQADAWEKAKLAKIKERYEKLNATISSWEDKKKKKARNKLDKTESGLERKRMRALEKFRSDMDIINQIAGGARSQAEERRRNEELKAKEKANIIRTTGKVPATCFCF
ncbi:hypothetical protein ACOSQ2_018243 [Xanthoceras sorbifolium]